ncbi:MAG: flagellar protein FlaG [Steroidobacteraceae bacterium]
MATPVELAGNARQLTVSDATRSAGEKPAQDARTGISAVERPADDRRSVAEAARKLQEELASRGHAVQFSIDKTSGHVVVSVRDTSTGELIRQIPSEEALRIAAHLTEMTDQSAALILDTTA